MRRKSKKSALINQEVDAGSEIERQCIEADLPAVAPVRCNMQFAPGELELDEAAIEASGQTDSRQRRFSAELVRDAQTYLEKRLNRKIPDDEVVKILTRLLEFGKLLRNWRS
ncbi:hypothetical protein KRR38_08410 [Novosphingobium sp. G106]|uniref:hypothetical protein n=1 Tax=Novosphingobium sp. G106 TaxID=2849500 RepID=UPI001C2DB3C1|nr:hypothetical protein [Novosphingobium sp. G106]MBV1687695.1 hypothetical protein [Novosphingobium sp. G106]